MGRFRQRVKRGAAAMSVVRQIMCLLNIEPALLDEPENEHNVLFKVLCKNQLCGEAK